MYIHVSYVHEYVNVFFSIQGLRNRVLVEGVYRAFEVLVVHDLLGEHLGGERREEEEQVHHAVARMGRRRHDVQE